MNQCPGLPDHQSSHQCTCYADVLESALTIILNKSKNKIIKATMNTVAGILLTNAGSEGIPYVGHMSSCSSVY